MSPAAKLFGTTAFKLSLAYLAVFTLVVGGAILYVAWQTSVLLNEQIMQTVAAETGALVRQYRRGNLYGLVQEVRRRERNPGSNLYLVASFTGDTIAGNVDSFPPGTLDRTAMIELSYRRSDERGSVEPHRAIAQVVVLSGGFRLLVGRDTEERDRFLAIVRRAAVSSIGLLVALGLAGGFVVSRRVLRRIDAVTQTSRTIMAGDLAGRIPVTGSGDEFDRLALSLNAMLERISELMRGLQDVSENIAHDLKTPLTRLRNRAEAALREDVAPTTRAALAEIIGESEELIRIFEALLMIARAEAGQARDQMTPLDLSQITQDVADLYEPVAEEAGLSFGTVLEEGLAARGNRELIGQAVANLIDNAIKHGGRDGEEGAVSVSARRREGAVEIAVADRGAGIPEADRGRVLERFVRLEDSRARPGSGLGLSLVAAVARLHGGTLRLEDNQPGLRAVLTLPAA